MGTSYLVKTWAKDGALTNQYEVAIDHAQQLKDLKAFLKKTHAHFLLEKQSKAKRK